MAHNQRVLGSCKRETDSRNESQESSLASSVGAVVNGHVYRDPAATESGTDDGPESPDSSEGAAPLQHVKKKVQPKEGSSTTESTPDKRECRCELCSGTSTVTLPQFFGEDSNQNVGLMDFDQNGRGPERQINGISSDEGIPTENCVFGLDAVASGGVRDGMELYFRDNMHLLEHEALSNGASTPEASPRNESLHLVEPVNGVTTAWGVGDYVQMTCSSSRHSGMQSSNGYGSDKGSHRGSDYDSDEGGVYVLPDDLVACSSSHKHTILNDSSEDQGDFIEADIPKNPYACSGDSSNSDSRRNSVSSSYEDLRQSNICPPNSANRTSTDEETFTKLVFEREPHSSASYRKEQMRNASRLSHNSSNIAISPVALPSTSNAPVLRPTNLFESQLQENSRLLERSNIMFTSASTESSSPFTMSSTAFMSSPYSDNSNSALNAPTSESSVFISPDREAAGGAVGGSSATALRREAFLRNQSMDNPTPSSSPCPLRPAKSSGDLEHGGEEEEEFSSLHFLTMSRSLHQNLGSRSGLRASGMRRSSSMMCRHCNKEHSGTEPSILRRSGSAGVSIVEGNEQSQVMLPREEVALRSNSEELLDRDSCPQVVCLSCHRRRFGTFSCDRNDCDVLETAQKKHEFCLHGRCTCSLSYYFQCVLDTNSDSGTDNTNNTRSNSSQSVYVRPRNIDSGPRVNSSGQNRLSPCSQHTNNLSRRVHHYIHHLHTIDNVSAQSSMSNSSHDDSSHPRLPRVDERRSHPSHSATSPSSSGNRLGNVQEISGEDRLEIQENEDNDNIENGRVLRQNRAALEQNHRRGPPPAVSSPPGAQALSLQQEQLVRDRGMRELKARGEAGDYAIGHRPRSGGIRILPLLLRSANTIDEMDPEAVMELSSMLHNDEESEDDGYVDFQKILKDYMVHKYYEKHSITSQWYRCDLECGHSRIEPAMIWTEYQAYLYHERQVGTSACGATAVINVLKALQMAVEQEVVCRAIKTNQRAESAPAPQYLLSRRVAGTTAEELIEGVHAVTGGAVYGRFFHMHPLRRVCVRQWLSDWIRKGAIPLVTLNLQKAVPSGYMIPDAWHHQMVFGVSQQGVFLTNPQEIVPEHVIMEQLSSEAVLMVQRKDVVSRWSTEDCDLRLLMNQPDPRWRTMNVLGQVINVLREEKIPHHMGFRPQLTEYIQIPACYKAGVTLFMKTDSEHCELLRSMPELSMRSERGKQVKDDKT